MPTQASCLILDTDLTHGIALRALCTSVGFDTHLHDLPIEPEQDFGSERLTGLVEQGYRVAFIDACLAPQLLPGLARGSLPNAEIFLMASTDAPEMAAECARAGVNHYFCKPFTPGHLRELLDDMWKEANGASIAIEKKGGHKSLDQFGLLRGSSPPMRQLFRLLRKFGPTSMSILITGESGCGKELVAETLHTVSSRATKPYLTLNCASLATGVVESELFGHEKGSFSGAHLQHVGFFERANGGTLFLDEVTEMPLDMQAKLLRTLESGEIRRVGAVKTIEVDVRIIAASNRNLAKAVQDGILREDLYFRLAHVVLGIPPLRSRGADITGLAQLFLKQLNERHQTGAWFTDDALAMVQECCWPGNVRELRHAVERAYILSDIAISPTALFPANSVQRSPRHSAPQEINLQIGMSMAECQRNIILSTLNHHGGDKKASAATLGISLKTLYTRLNDYADVNNFAEAS